MRRIECHPDVAELVARVPDADIVGCLHMLSLAAVSVTGYHAPELDDALNELRDRNTVSPANRLAVGVLLAQRDQQGFAAARRGDDAARERAFSQARAINCAAYAIGGLEGSPRERLGEAAYEATVACRGSESVIGVLSQYAD